MGVFGLLGRGLTHSFSPYLHSLIGDYSYTLFSKEETELKPFLEGKSFDGLNVTIPYKKAVIPFLDELSPVAEKLLSVNTVVKRKDGTLFGDNTDYHGFLELVKHENIKLINKKVLVLGSGGASVTVCEVIKTLGGFATVISRKGENNYDNISRHFDADIIVNTTPVGMFPKNGEKPLGLSGFNRLEAVIDIIYNPLKTAFLLEAENMGIKTANGLYMLVAQGIKSAELFLDTAFDSAFREQIYKTVKAKMTNTVLIGMPGCGKTTIAEILKEETGKPLFDSDICFFEKEGITPGDYIKKYGEERFRIIETEILREISEKSGVIISTGGGAVTRKENKDILKQNGVLVYIKRDIKNLATDDRPLSVDVEKLYKERKPMYEAFADFKVDNNKTPKDTALAILEKIK
ncbi:MAG: shikimate kinase [Clostridia bacterium]|nr:shikimate kinase [Clostridia bacterium]